MYTLLDPISSKIKYVKNLLKFDLLNISDMPTLI